MPRFAFQLAALAGCGVSIGHAATAKAVLNIIRHGEKCGDKANGLSPEGQARAQYLGECMSSSTVSRVMPYGKASAVMACISEEGKTTRPYDTVAPLAEQLGLQVQTPCLKTDSKCFAKEVQKMLSADGALVAAWTNDEIPDLYDHVMGASSHLNATLGLGVGHDWSKWQSECPSEGWDEPACASKGKACYDEIWQVTFEGTSSGTWTATGSAIFREGFAGLETGPCNADLAADEGFVAEGGSCQMVTTRDLCGAGLECKRRPSGTGNRICVKASESIVV